MILKAVIAPISRFLEKEGVRAYFVGGVVRDFLLGRAIADVDIAVEGKASELAQRMAPLLGGSFVLLDEERGIARVVLPPERGGWVIDLSSIGGSIEEDLARRDFTIDAMAMPLEGSGEWVGEKVVDPYGGKADLKARVVRAVSPRVFQEDPARLLRAVRLTAEYGFTLHKETEALIKESALLLSRVAGERVRDELCRLLSLSDAAGIFRYLDHLGLLLVIMPEMASTKGSVQPKEHFWDVFNHSLETVSAVGFILRESGDTLFAEEVREVVPWSDVLAHHFSEEISPGVSRAVLLKLAALLHDIAKPQTRGVDEKGRTRFLGHAQEGAVVVVDLLQRLRFSTHEIKIVEALILHHLRPGQWSDGSTPTRHALYRYFRDTGEVDIDTLFLNLADHLATRGPRLDLDFWKMHAEAVRLVLEKRFEEVSLVNPIKLLDGNEIMAAFNLKPGSLIGELLEVVREAQGTGEITTRDEALALVQRKLAERVAKATQPISN